MKRQLTVIETAPGNYTVHVGENFANALCVDEALGSIARWLFTDKPMFIKTPDEALDWFLKYRRPRPTQPNPPLQLERKQHPPTTGAEKMIPPTIGRVVWYYPGGQASIDTNVQPLSAQIAFVHSAGLINIGYLDKTGIACNTTSVRLVQEGEPYPPGGFCMWMPYQIGQAKAHASPTAQPTSTNGP